jgi:competence protein ComEA
MFNFSRGEQIAVIVLVASIAVGSTLLTIMKTIGSSGSEAEGREEGAPEGETITVDVGGAVKKPGIYTLPAGSRVFDSLLVAGGPLPDANLDGLNLAAPLQNKTMIEANRPSVADIDRVKPLQDKIVVEVPSSESFWSRKPKEQEDLREVTSSDKDKPKPLMEGELDLNVASQEDLARLPRIGPALAARIVEYRKANGPFKRVEDLAQVKGIGGATLSEIRKYVRVVHDTPLSESFWSREPKEQPELAGSLRTVSYNRSKDGLSPKPQREVASPARDEPPPLVEGKIDLNVASQEELVWLPGIGPALAGRIVEYRKANGPFRRVEDLAHVRGIGEATLSEIRKHIRIELTSLPESLPSPSPGPRAESSLKININTATAEELTKLPRIGATIARRIVEHRTANGPFRKIEDLAQVRGIGPKTLSDLKDLITLGSPDGQ